MRYLYTLLLIVAAPFLLFALYRPRTGKPKIGERWLEHFGFTPKLKIASLEKPIWVHAVSVGETIAAKPLILALRKAYPSTPIVITTTTTTGAQMAAKMAEQVDLLEHRYMPIDFAFCVKGFINAIEPKALLIMETELWPNTLDTAKKAGLYIGILNARLSQKAMKKYQKVQYVFNKLAVNIDHIFCQFQEDADRFITLGVDKQKTVVTGSVKFDLAKFNLQQQGVISLKTELKDRPVWIASSTHQGEDEIILNAHRLVLDILPSTLLILVPRHPERFSLVAKKISEHNFTAILRSEKHKVSHETQVYLADTLGEMMTMFAVSDLAFMAGSLLGDKVGGHNLLEPASLAKPILSGASYFNFQVIGDALIKVGACKICQTADEIANNVVSFLTSPSRREDAGKAALEIVEQNRGAVEKTMAILPKF